MQSLKQAYGLDVDKEKVYQLVGEVFTTDLYFLVNPVVVCVWAV